MSKQEAKNLFRDGETTWEEKTMHELIDTIYENDFIVESGEKDGNFWEKWNSGKLTQYGLSTYKTGFTNKTGSMYSSPDLEIVFPVKFEGFPKTFVATLERIDRDAFVTTRYSGNSRITAKVISTTSFSSGYSFYIHWVAIGRWK